MTVPQVITIDEKSAPIKTAVVPEPRTATETGQQQQQYNNGFLRTKCGKLKLCQIIVGLLALALVRSPLNQETSIPFTFLFVAVNVPLLTAVMLWDSLRGQRLRHLLELDSVWDRVELYYNAAAAGAYYVTSFAMLAVYVGFYNPKTNIVAAVFGMLACIGHAYNWWLVFREGALRRTIAAELVKAQRDEGTT